MISPEELRELAEKSYCAHEDDWEMQAELQNALRQAAKEIERLQESLTLEKQARRLTFDLLMRNR